MAGRQQTAPSSVLEWEIMWPMSIAFQTIKVWTLIPKRYTCSKPFPRWTEKASFFHNLFFLSFFLLFLLPFPLLCSNQYGGSFCNIPDISLKPKRPSQGIYRCQPWTQRPRKEFPELSTRLRQGCGEESGSGVGRAHQECSLAECLIDKLFFTPIPPAAWGQQWVELSEQGSFEYPGKLHQLRTKWAPVAGVHRIHPPEAQRVHTGQAAHGLFHTKSSGGPAYIIQHKCLTTESFIFLGRGSAASSSRFWCKNLWSNLHWIKDLKMEKHTQVLLFKICA